MRPINCKNFFFAAKEREECKTRKVMNISMSGYKGEVIENYILPNETLRPWDLNHLDHLDQWTTWTIWTSCTTSTTLTDQTTLTILTDQWLIKKIIAESALFTWSCLYPLLPSSRFQGLKVSRSQSLKVSRSWLIIDQSRLSKWFDRSEWSRWWRMSKLSTIDMLGLGLKVSRS